MFLTKKFKRQVKAIEMKGKVFLLRDWVWEVPAWITGSYDDKT